jgi:hypothetical protein
MVLSVSMNISVFNKYVQHIMAKLIVDTGTAGNPATGDTLRTAMTKVNTNFTELYDSELLSLSQGLLKTVTTNGDIKIQPNGTGQVEIDQLLITSDSITSLVTNGDVTLAGNGTGNVIIEAITIDGTTLSSADSTLITVAEALEVTGAATLGTSLTLASGATVTGILDEDAMGTNSATQLATQQSIKAYVDSTVTAQDLDVASDSGTAAVDLDSQSLTVTGGTGIGTTATGQAVTVNIDATVATLVGSQTLTNKILTSPTINNATIAGGTFSGTFTGDINPGTVTTNEIISNGSNADLTLDTVGTGDINLTAGADVNIPANIGMTFGDDGEKIEGDGTDLTISSSNEINTVSAGTGNTSTLLTSAGGIYLDANGNAIRLDATTTVNLYQAATLYGSFNHASSVFEIISKISNGDLKLKGVDGGSEITALTLDMSEAGAATFNSTVTLGSNNAIQFVDANESVKSDGTNLIFTSGGTAFKMPTSDGSAGQVLITDGAGTLSFDTVSTTTSSDTRAIIKNNKTVNTSARTVDYFQAAAFDMAWYFVALNDMTNDNTSGSVFTVCHNNSDAFIGGPRGGAAGSTNAMPTTSADIASSQVRVKITGPSADSKISFYKIPISRASTSDATAGVTVTTSNTDVDSASESIDTFAHASFRAAKYVILIDDNAKTETGVTEALVVHDGTNAFVAQYGTLQTGNNDMITLSAAISGSNVVLSAAGLTPNLSLKIHKTLLADSMTAESNANQKIIGATTVSSTATAFDSFDLDDATAAVYYVVGKNATEGAYSVQEVYLSGDIGEAGVSSGPFVSSKATTQLEFTGDFLDTTDNTVQLSISSTSGGSTTVNAYRINCLAGE